MVDESGIIAIEGSATLHASVTYKGVLDDRANPLFARGNKVNAQTEGGAIPFGTLRIREASYTPKGRILTLELCDLLTLLSEHEEEESDKGKVCLGKPKRVTDVINELLIEGGAPKMTGEIPGWMNIPPQGGNPIRVAGAIAWSRGYCLMIAPPEIVKPVKLNFKKSGGFGKSLNQLVDYNRSSTGEAPPSKIIVTANVPTVKSTQGDTNGGYCTLTLEFGRDRQVQIEECVYLNKREVTTQILESGNKIMPWLTDSAAHIFSEYKTEKYYYTPRSLVGKKSEDSDSEDCDKGIEMVLTKSIVTSTQPLGKVLSSWVTQHKLDKNKNIIYTNNLGNVVTVFTPYYSPIVAYEEITSYSYNFALEDASKSRNLKTQTIKRSKVEPGGKLFPKLYEQNARFLSNAVTPVNSEFQQQDWDKVPAGYKHTDLILKSLALYDSQAAEQTLEYWKSNNFLINFGYLVGLIVESNKTITSSNGQTQPPAPETLSLPIKSNAIEEKQEDLKVEIVSEFTQGTKGSPKTYQIQYPISDNPEDFDLAEASETARLAATNSFKKQAQELGGIMMALAWGRFKGVEIVLPIKDSFSEYKPLNPFTTIEETGAFRFLMDGIAIVWTPRRFLCKIKGIMAGSK